MFFPLFYCHVFLVTLNLTIAFFFFCHHIFDNPLPFLTACVFFETNFFFSVCYGGGGSLEGLFEYMCILLFFFTSFFSCCL
ncbi:hypothetical protein FN846DRAFT_967125 [Sphaerosporella brunnea]|uniref:Uncharacterized protein n=1 Tax=Sphaerosporella brunnea TaxID=1250544 RepID=A0A5J5ELC2_9PEZI|nr:hypothetical protein FN846DRAFT_967125 [Sphaerosporella brunnea]